MKQKKKVNLYSRASEICSSSGVEGGVASKELVVVKASSNQIVLEQDKERCLKAYGNIPSSKKWNLKSGSYVEEANVPHNL